MGKIILYHGTPDKYVMPKYGGGHESLKQRSRGYPRKQSITNKPSQGQLEKSNINATPNQETDKGSSFMMQPRCLKKLSACEEERTFPSFTG